jgi:hypothetical protein
MEEGERGLESVGVVNWMEEGIVLNFCIVWWGLGE